MDAQPAHAPDTTASSPATAVPMLRAVLLCDIVESTALVERLGDARAAALMQHHDQLLRQALSICRGQLIDRADGVLALFERPIQALDFALRYQRALQALGEAEGTEIKARIGIHVGDVMMWANDPADVRKGAKPFEVEGLAKPVAARLMNLALPGQILMSGMAQNLAQRAAGELGERAGRLRWLVHGRYRFKGVPAPMLVHEVGEAGLAPLRAPESGAKAWREVPLWRRPPVLAIEALMVGVLGMIGAWTTLRAPPAIAFAERDWVVVADLQNQTSEPLFDDALDMALRVGLEQSRHVNLMSQLQVERALARMQRQGQGVSRALATEIALREGARAVVLPTVAEVGGALRVSLEVIDPTSGVTVYSESADAAGREGVLPALDNAALAVRERLGETIDTLGTSHRPLEEVTTPDIEALRAFSLGVQARNEGRHADGYALFSEAVKRDPEFSMAWLRMAAAKLSDDLDQAHAHLVTAGQHRERLTHREELLLDATLAMFEGPARMLERWKLMAAMYPDEYRAFYNYTYFAYFLAQRYEDAAEFITPALVPANPQRAAGLQIRAVNLVAADRLPEALETYRNAEALGRLGYVRDYADALAAVRDYAGAARVLAQQVPSGFAGNLVNERLAEVSHPLDRGRWSEARKALDALMRAGKDTPSVRRSLALIDLSLRSYLPDAALAGDARALLAEFDAEMAQANALSRPSLEMEWLATAWLAAQAGALDEARRVLASLEPVEPERAVPLNVDMARVLEAEIALQEGRAEAAIALLEPRRGSANGLYQLHAVLLRAYLAAGRDADAMALSGWLATHRGRAFAEPSAGYVLQPANVIESNLALRAQALLARRAGDAAKAQAQDKAFAAAWGGDAAAAVVARRDALFD